jgi:hypothetical protein
MDYPNPRSAPANLRKGVRGWCARGERVHPGRSANANGPNGPAPHPPDTSSTGGGLTRFGPEASFDKGTHSWSGK